jgi:hypothetical protein
MVVPSGEGYWKQRYIDRERQLMTNELRRPLAAFKCRAVSFLVLAVDKDGHISKCDRWLYIYIYPWVISDWKQVPAGKLQTEQLLWIPLHADGLASMSHRNKDGCQNMSRWATLAGKSLSRITRWRTKLKFYVGWELGVLFALASVWPGFTSLILLPFRLPQLSNNHRYIRI